MFKVLFMIMAAAAIWFCTLAGLSLYTYHKLDRQTEAHVTQWKLIEYSASKVAIQAFYNFLVNDETREGQIIFSKPYYLNKAAAEKALIHKSLQKWTVWYNHQNPSFSSLEKSFPLKKCFNALLVLSLLGYLYILRQKALISHSG